MIVIALTGTEKFLPINVLMSYNEKAAQINQRGNCLMISIFPSYRGKWEPLSEKHRELEEKLETILKEYSGPTDPNWSNWANAVVGVFGSGKTQFLYHVFEKSLEQDFLPLYFVAEDLFGKIFSTEESNRTPGALTEIALSIVEEIKEAIARADRTTLEEALNPKKRKDVTEMINDLLERFASKDVSNAKTVVLVDELEQQYKSLQKEVRADEQSPLRDWLERKDCLKFIALAPAGIYEMGGADQTRCFRLIIPAVDVSYIRRNYFPEQAGRADACWWLSRGKPRHVFKAFQKLRDLNSDQLEPGDIQLFVRDELDSIGQEPSSVPAAVLEGLSIEKWQHVLNLLSICGESKNKYRMKVDKLDSALFAEKLTKFFKLRREDAVLISYYLKMVLKALSDNDNYAHVEPKDLSELFALCIDLLLEYEHASPGVKERLGEFMRIYQESKDEALHAYLHDLCELVDTTIGIPLSIGEVRNTFPFPVMNPIVKGHVPKKMREKWEGNDLPIWRWQEGNTTILFFASRRDFEEYAQTDEFLDLALPKDRAILYVLPIGQTEKENAPMLQWLERNGKLRCVVASPLLTDFLLSASGEIEERIPGSLMETLTTLREDKTDPILSRKAKVYFESIYQLVKGSTPRPLSSWIGAPPDSETLWGKRQIGDRNIVVPNIALAYADIKLQEKKLIAQLHELFKGGREGKGTGELHFGLPRGGYISMATDVLPRFEKDELKEAPPILRLRTYFKGESELTSLVRLVPLGSFLKLEGEEDLNRLLEAFWRAIRDDFDSDGLDDLLLWLERDVLATIGEALGLEERAINFLKIEGIDFEDSEQLVRAKSGIERLIEGTRTILTSKSSAASLLKALHKLYAIHLMDLQSEVVTLQNLTKDADNSLNELQEACENLKKNYWEYGKAVQFAELKEDDIDKAIAEETAFHGKLTIENMKEKIVEGKSQIESITGVLSNLQTLIDELENYFRKLRG